jgi:limonene-1,2-epoxide hydrolase
MGRSLMQDASPVDVVRKWVDRFNAGDAAGLAQLYEPDAVNHQVVQDPVAGREAIHAMFESEFARAEMRCIVEQIHDAGEWAILEWRDPKGLRGCGFFHVVGGRIRFQRGYFDRLTFLRSQGLPLPPA